MEHLLESSDTDEVTLESPRLSSAVNGAREAVQSSVKKALMGPRIPKDPTLKPLVGKSLGIIDDLTSKPLSSKLLTTIDDLKSKPLRAKPMHTESLEKDVVIISKSLWEWFGTAPRHSTIFDSPDAVQAAYLRTHPQHAPFFKVLAPQLGQVCATIVRSMTELEQEDMAAMFSRVAHWQKNLIFDPSRIKNPSDLKNEYWKYAENDKKIYEVSKTTIDAHFGTAYRNLQQKYADSFSKLKGVVLQQKNGIRENAREKAETRSTPQAIKAQTDVSRIHIAHLSPSLRSALKRRDPSVDNRLQQKFGAVDWDGVMPSLAMAIGQRRLKTGGDRIRRLTESQKMEALLSNRQDKLTPFILALCSFLEDDVDIQRSMRELELSQNPRDAIRIILASDASRRAAMKVRQIPKVWEKFESALVSIGVSLKDLHLQREDEDEESDEIDMEMLREVEEEKEEVMDTPEQNDDPEHADSISRTRGILQKRIAMQETLYGETSGQKPVDDIADEFEAQVVPLENAASIAQLRGSLRKRMVLETLFGEVSTMELADETDDSPIFHAQAGVEVSKETPESVYLVV